MGIIAEIFIIYKTCSSSFLRYNMRYTTVFPQDDNSEEDHYMTTIDRIADLSMIWKQASQVFPYFDRNKIDWDKAYQEYLQKILDAKNEKEFHLLLAEFITLLNDGHTNYIFPKSLRDDIGYLPFILRYVQDTYCIAACIPEYQTFSCAQVISINDVPFCELAKQAARYSYCVGNFVTRINQMLPFLLKRTGNEIETSRGRFSFDLSANEPSRLKPKALTLPVEYRKINSEKLDIRQYANGVLYIKTDDFLYNNAFEEVKNAMEQTQDLKGIIFDLRENIGGMTRFGVKIAELLISGQFHGCRKHTRSMTGSALASASQIARWTKEAIEEHIAAGYATREEMDETVSYITNTHYDRYENTYGSEDHKAMFSGPCVILTSRYTVSAAEDFVSIFRASRRATIIGTATSGTTGTPLMQQLLCGGWFRVCSIGYQMPDGTEFIGSGIEPDIFCEATVEELERGYDSVLEKALTIMNTQIKTN